MFRKGAHPSKTRHLTKPLYQVSKGFENLYFWFSTFFVLSGQPCRIWTDVKGLLNDVVFNWLLKLPNMVVIKLWGGLEGGQHITPSNRRRIKKGLLTTKRPVLQISKLHTVPKRRASIYSPSFNQTFISSVMKGFENLYFCISTFFLLNGQP